MSSDKQQEIKDLMVKYIEELSVYSNPKYKRSAKEWEKIIESKISPNSVTRNIVAAAPPNRTITKAQIDAMSADPQVEKMVKQTLENMEEALNRLDPLPTKSEKALHKHLGTIYSFMLPGLSDKSVEGWETEFKYIIKKSLDKKL